ncbi:MAG: hypothetical protein WCO44_03310 [Bacteroidota bacterium]
MNDAFNINRFRLLARRQWAENKNRYLLLWGEISLALVLISILKGNDLSPFKLLLFLAGGYAVTVTLFSSWHNFGRSSFYLLLPASALEKLACGLLYSLVLYVPLYCINYIFSAFILTYLVVLPMPNNLLPFSTVIMDGINGILTTPVHVYLYMLLTFIFIQSVLMLILLTFRKRQKWIFLLVMAVILLVYNLGMMEMMAWFTNIPAGALQPPGSLPFYFPNFGFTTSPGERATMEYFSFTRQIRILNYLVWFVVIFILYLTAWYKLREREL